MRISNSLFVPAKPSETHLRIRVKSDDEPDEIVARFCRRYRPDEHKKIDQKKSFEKLNNPPVIAFLSSFKR
jgi:hypothetical protein